MDLGSEDGTVVRALASHEFDSGLIPEPCIICGLNLLLVLYFALRGFSLGTPDFPSLPKPTFPNFNLILECLGISELLGALSVNKLHIYIYPLNKNKKMQCK